MNRLSLDARTRILGCLVEGNSLRATSRMCDVSIHTVTKLLIDVGTACDVYQNEAFRNLKCRLVQVDEIWTFCQMKNKNVPPMREGKLGYGDVYTWVAIDAETKLVPSWLVGKRDFLSAQRFIADLASRMANRIQLTSDGNKRYLRAVEDGFAGNVDYAMLAKIYANPTGSGDERRYSAGQCCGAIKGAVCGNPDEKHISTSFIERQNLTMRM